MKSAPQSHFGGSPISDSARVSDAAEILACMAEQAWQIGAESAVSEALGAAFEYVVQYLHHLTIDGDEPSEALARTTANRTELLPAQLESLREYLRLAAERQADELDVDLSRPLGSNSAPALNLTDIADAKVVFLRRARPRQTLANEDRTITRS